MNRKIFSLLLAVASLLSSAGLVSAENSSDENFCPVTDPYCTATATITSHTVSYGMAHLGGNVTCAGSAVNPTCQESFFARIDVYVWIAAVYDGCGNLLEAAHWMRSNYGLSTPISNLSCGDVVPISINVPVTTYGLPTVWVDFLISTGTSAYPGDVVAEYSWLN